MAMTPVLYRNGSVYSAGEPFATAMLVQDGIVAWLGSEEGADAQAQITPGVRVIDLAGSLIAPAFVDAVLGRAPRGSEQEAFAAKGVATVLVPSEDVDAEALDTGLVEILPIGVDGVATAREPGDALSTPVGVVLCTAPAEWEADGSGNELLAASSAGVPLAFGSGWPDRAIEPWLAVRAGVRRGLSARAAFMAHTRGSWRASGLPDAFARGRLEIGAEATFAIWDADELVVQGSDQRRSAWSTDPRAGVPVLPDLGDPHVEEWSAPECVATARRGVTVFEARSPSPVVN